MLCLHPAKRAKSSDLKHHKWREDITIKRKAAEERRVTKSCAMSGEMVAVLDQNERDAVKAMDESVLLVDGEEGEGAQGAPDSPGVHLNAPLISISNSHSPSQTGVGEFQRPMREVAETRHVRQEAF
jgi:hypothetical protein